MSKKNTALMELIQQLEKTIPEIANGNAIDKTFWLEKEKSQIINAFTDGQIDIINDSLKQMNLCVNLPDDKEDGEEYFNKTYNK